MGLLDSMLGGIMDAGVATIEKKYRTMPLSDLKREWNSVYAHKGFPSGDINPERIVAANSPNGILDRIYAERTGMPSWRERFINYQQRTKQKAIEKERQEEEKKRNAEKAAAQRAAIEKKRQEEKRNQDAKKLEQDSLRFKEQLSKSSMAKIIIDKINSLGDKAAYIAVFPDQVVVSSNDYFLASFFYEDDKGLAGLDSYEYLDKIVFREYKCPSLNNAQILGLRLYIEETAEMNFKFICRKDRYKHKDYSGCLKRVEEDPGTTASW